MKIIRSVREMRDVSFRNRTALKTVGFVPTMGCLHEGHISLIRSSVSECDFTVVSVFVNPVQFAEGEDLEKYPRELDRDISLLEKENIDVLFVPDTREMYPEGYSIYVDAQGGLTERFCGASRPGHFRGVATVVAKLFNIVDPDKSYFGQKDIQQVLLIKKMVADLNFRTEIRVLPTVRDSNGLAMSSRNRYLSQEDTRRALLIFKAIEKAKETAALGEKSAEVIRKSAVDVLLSDGGVTIDYIDVVDVFDLETVKEVKDKALLILAVVTGGTRLIDNAEIISGTGKV